jgi:hypothetical protein
MKREFCAGILATAGCITLGAIGPALPARAITPCGDFEECKVLVEMNTSDGDIGFQWLVDGEDLVSVRIDDPNGKPVFANKAMNELHQQYLSETTGESAEPKCRKWLAEPGEDVVTLRQFLNRWPRGTYSITGMTDDGQVRSGKTALTAYFPAAPRNLTFSGGVVTWQPGTALGVCATEAELWQMVSDNLLPVHPMNVPVREWEITLALNDGSGREFSLRLPARGPMAQMSVTISPEFMNAVGPDTPAAIEVGAIGGRLSSGDQNASFTELTDLCLHKQNGCPPPTD